jgi:hypothetical protein
MFCEVNSDRWRLDIYNKRLLPLVARVFFIENKAHEIMNFSNDVTSA